MPFGKDLLFERQWRLGTHTLKGKVSNRLKRVHSTARFKDQKTEPLSWPVKQAWCLATRHRKHSSSLCWVLGHALGSSLSTAYRSADPYPAPTATISYMTHARLCLRLAVHCSGCISSFLWVVHGHLLKRLGNIIQNKHSLKLLPPISSLLYSTSTYRSIAHCNHIWSSGLVGLFLMAQRIVPGKRTPACCGCYPWS